MKIRLAFLKRQASGEVALDGFEVYDAFDIDILPRVGECVILPEPSLATIREKMPELAIHRRFEVVSIDHHWNTIGQQISVYIAEIRSGFLARTSA